jgi:hypothetical protein
MRFILLLMGGGLEHIKFRKILGPTLVPLWLQFLEYFCHDVSAKCRTILEHQKLSPKTKSEWERIFIHLLVQNLNKHNTLNNNNNNNNKAMNYINYAAQALIYKICMKIEGNVCSVRWLKNNPQTFNIALYICPWKKYLYK